MDVWSEEYTETNLDQILLSQSENRAWHKTLRTQAAALVDSRLAKLISHGAYLESRIAAAKETTECTRRAGILSRELVKYGRR